MKCHMSRLSRPNEIPTYRFERHSNDFERARIDAKVSHAFFDEIEIL